jgi:hypothetical protein
MAGTANKETLLICEENGTKGPIWCADNPQLSYRAKPPHINPKNTLDADPLKRTLIDRET